VAAAVALGASGGAAALVIAALTGAIAQTGAFFGGGALTLAACLALARRQLARAPRRIVRQAGLAGAARLGVRNAPRHLGRSMLTIGLIASASFLIGALSAFNLAPDTGGRNSGSGGFALIAEAAAPLTYDLGSPQGRAELGLDAQAEQDVAGVEVFAFRLRDGDESSCLNLYKPVEPRLVGAPRELIERGGFRFSQILAGVADPANPWKALEASLPEGAIPVIGDEAAVLWQLHAGLGKSLAITDERGRTAELVFVALLSGSALQDELIVSDKSFERLFPSVDGRAFFLIDTGKAAPERVSAALERSLAEYGFDGASSAARIRAYLAVQNTYLSTFQTLGGFGLALGAVGLVAVMLRNVLERRRELALLRAVGFERRLIGVLVIAENAALVLAGLLAGLIAALVAVAPAALSRPATIPWVSLGLTLAAALAVSLGCGALALRSTLRGPILSALRAE
jgi:hypothetical protein